MANVYGNSNYRKKQGNTQNDYIDDCDDDDDYENSCPFSIAPAVPSRAERRKKDAVNHDLAFKCMDKPVPVKEPAPIWTTSQREITEDGKKIQPPRIGLDFSSGAVNAAFADISGEVCLSHPAVAQFPHMEVIHNNHKQKNTRHWKTIGFVVVTIILLILVAFIGIVFMRYSSVSEELDGLMHNVSYLQLKAKMDQDYLEALQKDKDEAIVKLQDSLKADIIQNNKTLMKFQDNIKTDLNQIKKTLESLCKSCPTDWKVAISGCYFFSEDQLSWDAARQACCNVDSFLLIVKNEQEMNSLKTFFSGKKTYWIGLRRDPKAVNTWRWTDGTQASYVNWHTNEPNFSGKKEHCAETTSGSWNDMDCAKTNYYICKRTNHC
ncbi:C-type lectin domain family 4 member G-like [Hyperolius riggenbachi]|uniref:C-type lectin domain family 4 member G-like n=1 Tax=Hyperolius riggenbachi TaxID=752182 RepID=UPI0035A2A3D8